MKPNLAALIALAPYMFGMQPVAANPGLTARICGGGSISIPLDDRRDPPKPPCEMKGCHAGCQRKRFDRTQ